MSRATVPVTLEVNGETWDLEVEPRWSLAEVVRSRCGLTGTHLGCEQGICGSCTVLVDGDPVRSCLIYAVQCRDSRITTIEGLAAGGDIADLMEAFSIHHGLQCGFCTPGFLVLASAVLERDPSISDGDLEEALSSNLCRCTGYYSIIKAVRSVRDQTSAC